MGQYPSLKDLGTYEVPGSRSCRGLLSISNNFSHFSGRYESCEFKNSEPLKSGLISIQEMTTNGADSATLMEIYFELCSLLGLSVEKMIFTENRIREILLSGNKRYKKIRKVLMIDKYWSFFLLQGKNELEVARVSKGLELVIFPYSSKLLFCSTSHNRFIVEI